MAITDAIANVAALLNTALQVLEEARKEHDAIKKASFSHGLDELHTADERMRLEDRQHGPPAVPPV
jgi:hypothetical protein